MDWSYIHKVWDKWASNNIGTSGEGVLKGALLINYDLDGPSRLLSTIAEQAGIKSSPLEVSRLIKFVKQNNLAEETFCLGPNEYLVTSIHDNWFHARSMNATALAGEGAIVTKTAAFLPEKKRSEDLKEISRTIEFDEDESEEEKKSTKKRKRKGAREESVESFNVFSGSSITSEYDRKKATFLFVALYDGSNGAASSAMEAVDQLSDLLSR